VIAWGIGCDQIILFQKKHTSQVSSAPSTSRVAKRFLPSSPEGASPFERERELEKEKKDSGGPPSCGKVKRIVLGFVDHLKQEE